MIIELNSNVNMPPKKCDSNRREDDSKERKHKMCSNPYRKSHSRAAHRSSTPVVSLDDARRVFPNFIWTPESLLFARCRIKITEAAKMLQIVQAGVRLAQQATAKRLEAKLSEPGPSGEVHLPALAVESQITDIPEDLSEAESVTTPRRHSMESSSGKCVTYTRQNHTLATGHLVIITISNEIETDSTPVSRSPSPTNSGSSTNENLLELNKTLEDAGVHVPSTSQRKRPSEWRKAYDNAKGFLQKKIFKASGVHPSPDTNRKRTCFFCKRLLSDLAAKFRIQKTREEQYKVLTCIPRRYTYREVAQATGCSERVAKQSKKLLEASGAYSYPAPKKGRPISPEVVNLIQNFYQCSRNSRASPRAKDVVKVRHENGEIELKHRVFLLDNLSDFYHKFLDENKNVKVSVSKFAELRPRNCVWPGKDGHHITCVCEIHENFKFLLRAIGYDGKTEDFINAVVCKNKKGVRDNCHLGYCSDCPSEIIISEILDTSLLEDEISYQVWTHTDATDIQWQTVNTDEFRRIFLLSVPKIIEHEYITGKQFRFMKNLREDRLRNSEAATVQVDFAQNNSFVVQNAVQVSSKRNVLYN